LSPKICVSVMERTVENTVKALRRLEAHNPDLIEIRFDLIEPYSSISEIREATDRRIIATNRLKNQGGFFAGSERERLWTLRQAARESFDYVDIELKTKDLNTMVRQVKRHGSNAIVSYHNSSLTPSQNVLQSILTHEKRAGANICKIVCTARTRGDNLRCLTFVNAHAHRTKLVCFAMGKLGRPSRILSPLFGADFTFASLDSHTATAKGQLSIDNVRNVWGLLGVH
jgi:3-dehydroquinate dehydratase-1